MMFDWILQRGQIDFGNLAVGIGTALLAFASFKSVRNLQLQQDRHEISAWRDSLRSILAEYHASCVRLSTLRKDFRSEDRSRLSDPESKSLYAEMTALRSQIMLMLDDNRAEHVPLLEQCQLLQKAAFDGHAIQAKDFTRTARRVLRAQ